MADASKDSSKKDDEISLDGLMGDDVLASPSSTQEESPAAPTGAVAPEAAGSAKDDQIDGLLASEDPNFAQAMAELKAEGANQPASEAEIDTLDLDKLKNEKMPGRVRLFFGWVLAPINSRMGAGHTVATRLAQLPGLAVVGLRKALGFGKAAALFALHGIVARIADFRELSAKSKLTLFAAIGLGALAAVTLKLSLGKTLEFRLDKAFFRSFAEIADARFEYDEDEPMEEFTDPLFHPEHMMLLDKFVINLRHPRDGSANPMGLFEFYLEASNQESAVEVKDRQGEIRDVIGRSLEQMTYDDLMTADGKEKMKVLLRKAVNSTLTRGQLRHVYIKTIVLKP